MSSFPKQFQNGTLERYCLFPFSFTKRNKDPVIKHDAYGDLSIKQPKLVKCTNIKYATK